jgi:uncharacterized membrane protein
VVVVLDTGDPQPIIAAYVSTKARLEAFSDGIFAIAATLLVLDLAIPKPEPTLLNGFLQSWPSYAAYATSFVTIGIIWVNHHAVLERMERIDRGLLFLNLILMLFVALIPFPTKVLAHYLQSGGANAHTAAAAYGVAMMLMGISFSLINVYAVARGLFPDHQRLTLWQQIRFSIGLVMYAAGTGLSWSTLDSGSSSTPPSRSTTSPNRCWSEPGQ